MTPAARSARRGLQAIKLLDGEVRPGELSGQWQNATIVVIAVADTMANLSVRDIPKAVHEVLRKSAKQHHRSLNGEILEILTYHAERERSRQQLKRLLPELHRLRERLARKYPNAPDSVQLIREDRDSR